MPITTCPKCSRLYEATSEEEANAPTRECGTCFALRKAEAQRADFRRQLAAEREHRMQLERIVDEVRARNRELEAAQSATQRSGYERGYRYLQDRLESIGYHGWAHDMDDEIRRIDGSGAMERSSKP